MKRAGQSNLKGLNEPLEHHLGKKTGARKHKFSAADVARIRGSGNVYRDFNLPDADVRQFKAILAAEIIKKLDKKSLSVRKAQSLTGVPAADFSRIRTADLERFSSDRLMMIHNKLGSRVEVSVRVKERKLEAVHA
ncbi:MAG: XRE family transcriptional regulator [Nitrospiraceae bacterium]|nr:MAG: XRE family transcriptional regulator [Nitrospiraceae bacterium]